MPIEFHCQKCNKLLRVPDGSAGKKAQCPSCQTILEIPTAAPPPPTDPFAAPSEPKGSSAPGPGNQGSSPFSGPGSFAPPGQAPPPTPPPMSDNPFASPMASASHPPEYATSSSGSIVPTQIEIGDVMSEAFRIFKSDMGLLIGAYVFVTVVTNGLNQVIEVSTGPLIDGLQEAGIGLVVLLHFASTALGIFLGIGQTVLVLNIVAGRKANFSDLFSGGPYFWRVLGASILVSLMVMFGLLLLIVPGIILALMFGQFYNLIVDRNVGVMDSLSISKEITTGNKATLLVLGFVAVGISILGLLACCIGIIFAAPYIQVMVAVAYRKMAGLPIKHESTFSGPVA